MLKDESINKYKSNKVYLITYWSIVAVLIFLMAFKGFNVGTDSLVYKNDFYEAIVNGTLGIINDYLEPGYCLLCYILGLLNISYLGMQIIVALFVNITFAIFFYKISSNKLMSLILYVCVGIYFSGFNIVRQSLAICFVLYAIMILLKNKKLWWVYLLLVGLGATFHKSVLMFIPILILFYIKLDNKKIIAIFILTTISMFFFRPICIFLKNNFDIQYIKKYIDTSQFDRYPEIKSIILTTAYMIFFVALLIYEKLRNKKIQSQWIKNLFLCFVILRYCSLAGCFSYLTIRVADNLLWIMTILIPEILMLSKNQKEKNILTTLFIVGYAGLMIIQVFVLRNFGIIPYSFVW